MKRLISLILAPILCLGLCACGAEDEDRHTDRNNSNNLLGNVESDDEEQNVHNDGQSGNTGNDTENQTESEPLILYDETAGHRYINIRRFRELLVTVELTTENWMDYIEVCSYTVEKIEKDDFGEIISTQTSTCYELGAKGNKYYHFQEFVIELRNKQTGKLVTYRGHIDTTPEVEEDFCLDQYECTRIKGTLYLIDIPEETIALTKEGRRFFEVGHSDFYYGESYLCDLYGTNGRRVGGMFDFFAYDLMKGT